MFNKMKDVFYDCHANKLIITKKGVHVRQVISLDLSEFIGYNEQGPMKKQ